MIKSLLLSRLDISRWLLISIKIKIVILMIFGASQNLFGQEKRFIPIDLETLEFIKSVNYYLYNGNILVFKSQTSQDSITRLPEITFDSISFKKKDYKDYGIKYNYLTETVPMQKEIFALDEVVITSNREDETILGEKSRFIKRQSRTLSEKTDFGVLFDLKKVKQKKLSSLTFYVDKVKYETLYNIKFYSIDELGNPLSYQYLDLKNLIFQTDTLIINKGSKNEVNVDLLSNQIVLEQEKVFVSIEVLKYKDGNNIKIKPEFEDRTKIKLQLSNNLDFYSRTINLYTKESSENLININLMINYDFATDLFMVPHKSVLLAPAILLNFQ